MPHVPLTTLTTPPPPPWEITPGLYIHLHTSDRAWHHRRAVKHDQAFSCSQNIVQHVYFEWRQSSNTWFVWDFFSFFDLDPCIHCTNIEEICIESWVYAYYNIVYFFLCIQDCHDSVMYGTATQIVVKSMSWPDTHTAQQDFCSLVQINTVDLLPFRVGYGVTL